MKALTRSIFVFLIAGAICPSRGQEFTIRKVEVHPENLILHYDLIDTLRSRHYTISVYSSKDNFLAPLHEVRGDVGLEVRPGANKKITWHAKKELGPTFNGDIELEIRGRVYIPFVKFEGFHDYQVIKRGKPTTITWSGGTRQNILNFYLYKDDKQVDVIPNIANTGHHDIVLSTSVKPGIGYYFIVQDSKNKDQTMRTPAFQVKRKIPLALKTLPLIAVGAAIYLLTPDGTNELDTPPGVPDN